MKHIAVVIAFITSILGLSFGWEKYPANPVIDLGEEGSWNDVHVSDPAVIFDGEVYHMWFAGDNGSQRGIGYARSVDGVHWEMYPGNPVLTDGIGDVWDGEWVSQPTVVRHGDLYHMWYTGYNGEHTRIGYAVSADGIHWSKSSANPVLDLGPAGSWDSEGVSNPTVIVKDELFHMWYAGYDGVKVRIGYAISSDGIHWNKHSSNPVLEPGPDGEWDDAGVSCPSVIYAGEAYRMWYAGYDGDNLRIGYATSGDGITWSKRSYNPVLDLGPAGSWDGSGVSGPSVVLNGVTYHMWYTGYDGARSRIGYAFHEVPGDTSGDGTISAYDAGLILQFVVGLIEEFPADRIGAPEGVRALPSYAVAIPRLSAKPGGRIRVPLYIEDATGLYAGGFRLRYDPSVLKAVEATPSSLLNGSLWRVNLEMLGEIRFAFATPTPLRGGGKLLEITFEVTPDAEGLASPVTIIAVNLNNSVPVRIENGLITVSPSVTRLLPNYPNPFNPETWIPFKLAEKAHVTIRIYDLSGRLVRTLDLGEREAGVYLSKDKAAFWDGRDMSGRRVASGVYFCRLQAGDQTDLRPITVLK